MADDEKKDETTEETPVQDEDAQSAAPVAEEAPAEEPAAAEAPAADAGGDSSDEDDDRPWKEKRRLERSRRPHEAGPALSAEERVEKRLADRRRRAAERRKGRAAAKAKHQAGTGTAVAEHEANAAKIRQGIVVSDSFMTFMPSCSPSAFRTCSSLTRFSRTATLPISSLLERFCSSSTAQSFSSSR